MFYPQLLFLPIIAALFSLFIATIHGAPVLPEVEVQTLQTVFTRLQMENDFTPSFCGDNARNLTVTSFNLWNITCDCTHNNSTVCHVTNFRVNKQYLTVVIPEELGNLTFLQKIDLFQNYLNGTIPISLGWLPNLVHLSLPGNRLSGPIPEEIGNIATLELLDLSQNFLNGTIPVSLGRLPNLVNLSLSGNNLSGLIPEEIGNITTLVELDFSENILNGTIPASLGRLSNLVILSLLENILSGPIPNDIGNIATLKEVSFSGNSLSGPIPEKIGNIATLVDLDFSENNLNGTIPISLGRLSNLAILTLSGNRLSGPIPKEIGNIATLVELDFSENNLNGTIPASLGRLSNLVILYLCGNHLSGPISKEIGNIAKLKELDLSQNYLNGTIPVSLGRLPNLVNFNLSQNHLDGMIPASLGRLPNLVNLNLSQNRLNGTIPASLGRLPNLVILYLWGNRLGGLIPEEIGNIATLEKLDLSANNFTRPIPDSFRKLLNLTDFWIDGNNLTEKIPDFIGNWTQLETLSLQGASMEGPIPSHISSLRNLIELRISDLRGPSSSFSNLKELTNMRRLILRNCMLTGAIPQYIGNMENLQLLDLSFNRLTGPIPKTFQHLNETIYYMFLTNNSLNGTIPDWMLDSGDNFDLSYNNFTGIPPENCQQNKVNLVSSFSSTRSNSLQWCLMKDLPCPETESANRYSLFINCGGSRMKYNGYTYEGDTTTEGPSNFFASISNMWAYSSTGVYMEYASSNYIARNRSEVNVTSPEYYNTARFAPLSLKYYGFCMRQGNYRVQLHFAELYSEQCGRRIFDVSIQGQVVLENFNIAEEAGGVGIGINKTFDNVIVSTSTLEIYLYWRGKGNAAISSIGAYGPLISAITVTPNFEVDTRGFSVGAIVGIVISSVVAIILLSVLLWMKCFRTKEVGENDLRGLDLQTGIFTLRQIKAATNNFDLANKIGEGGFGPVYKGTLSDGAIIAVKQLSSKSRQGNREFVNEICMISALQHPNLVRLYGCCIEGNQLLLIYEYMENNSLARALFGGPGKQLNLDWKTRKSICIGIARGLAYLHEESRLKIVHRDIKATNVLLDKDLNAKISDFGLAKLDEEENTHISTRIAGTIGYMALEYAMRGYLTDKADVYSFGIVALEVVSGKSNTNYRPKEEFVYLLDWAYVLQEQGNLLDLVDPCLDSNYSTEEAKLMLNIALLCTNPSPTLRPAMSSVVSMLEGKIPAQAPIIKGNGAKPDARFRAFEMLSQDSQTQVSSLYSHESREPRSMSIEGPCIDSTISLQSADNEAQEHSSSSALLEKDLYTINLH